ncbi:hypothetical protein O181_073165, partial [Austropuccinia psidii MF-1]|nr:hypothetical protein [Austropuccinia psidii MF-1]
EALRHFHQLKEVFTTPPILSHFNPSLPTIVETDAADYALGSVLSQVSDSGKHPIAFDSSKRLPEELNYEIHDKDLLGIKALWKDSQYRSILQDLGKGKSIQDYSLDTSSQLLLFKDWVVAADDPTIQLSIFQKRNDSPLAGHPGKEKTLKIIKWDFYWSGMTQFIKDYVLSCQQCSRNKNIHHKKFGLLRPLPIPNGPWICLSMDFITQFPLSNSFDSILVIVDRFSNHGLPSSIVNERGSIFVSSFWTNLCQQLKISRDLSSPYHPETDGQTERVNQILEQYLWIYFSYNQDDWNTLLPLAEFAYNNSDNSSTKQLPLFTFYGRDPQFE